MGKRILDNFSLVIAIVIVIFDFFVWYQVIAAQPRANAEMHFLDVGQGDSTLLALPGGVEILTDAGPDRKVVRSVESALARGDKYIDLAVITHPQLDHFNGFNYLLERYEFGAFIINGRTDAPAKEEWGALIEKLEATRMPIITLGENAKIRYGENVIEILSPDEGWRGSGELNDTGIVGFVKTPQFTALLTADIGANVEEELLEQYDLKADILKVGHHGSKYSSSQKFLEEVRPRLAVIGVGENRYGHPTKEALDRLASVGAKIFRTDKDGTVKVLVEDNKLKVFAEKKVN